MEIINKASEIVESLRTLKRVDGNEMCYSGNYDADKLGEDAANLIKTLLEMQDELLQYDDEITRFDELDWETLERMRNRRIYEVT